MRQGWILGTNGRGLVGLSDTQDAGQKVKMSEGSVLGSWEEGTDRAGAMGGGGFERGQVWSFPGHPLCLCRDLHLFFLHGWK